MNSKCEGVYEKYEKHFKKKQEQVKQLQSEGKAKDTQIQGYCTRVRTILCIE